MFLILAAIAVWMTFFINRARDAELKSRLAVLRPLARELIIENDHQIAAVKLEELWFDDNEWDVYLPSGEFRLCIATREIDQKGLPSIKKSTRLRSGRHQLSLEQIKEKTGWRIAAKWDGEKVLEVTEPLEWNRSTGSTGGSEFTTSTQFDVLTPAVFFRRRFMKPTGRGLSSSPAGPTEGVMLWVERVRE